MKASILAATLSPLLLAASCGATSAGDSPASSGGVETGAPFAVAEYGSFDEPWAAAFAPGTPVLFITEKPGTIKFVDTETKRLGTVTGVPEVDYGGQGGLGDIAFLPSEADDNLGERTIYLSWVEAGPADTRGAVVGRGQLVCEEADACRIEAMRVIWRQPKVSGRGHFSHRIEVSPDGEYLFVSSGERMRGDPAQDTSNNLGSVVRLNLDGTPAAGNPFAGQTGKAQGIWSWGHRNILGLDFDAQGRLWAAEHGPAGGDEFNLIEKGKNYGWPVVSEGDHYNGGNIPPHSTRPEFAAPAVNWNPVIAPGDFIFYNGELFDAWKGQAIIAAMKPSGLVRVAIDGEDAREVARHPMDRRIREIVEGPDGAIWLLEDKEGGRLLKLASGFARRRPR